MAHRTYRLAVSPEDTPEVRRVIDFDGRSSLHDLHAQIAKAYQLRDRDRRYVFFLSGRAWDKTSAYVDPRSQGQRADRALLFRLGLGVGKSFLYVFDFALEQRYSVSVVAVHEVGQSLLEPALIESVGVPPAVAESPAAEQGEEGEPAELSQLVPLAEAQLDSLDALDALDEDARGDPARTRPILCSSADAALELLAAVANDAPRFFRLDEWLLQRSLAVRLLDLPLELAQVGEYQRSIALARALVFVDRELCEGDLAIVLAKAGRRDEALAQLEANLGQARDKALVETKAGETHRALGDLPAAEAYFRRAVVEATTNSERLQALLGVAGCLMDQGRDAEANAVLNEARKLELEATVQAAPPAVGRNEPCPCGSGKKYKKCHG